MKAMPVRSMGMKVGELAKRTGLTIRTLHHYDEIGLLRPSLHSDSGHRMYTDQDIARLQQIVSLRQLGFTLEEIARCLDQPGYAPLEIIQLHLSRLKDQIRLQRELCDRLELLALRFRDSAEINADQLLKTIEEMTMIEKLYTPEQMKQFEEAGKAVGQAEMTAVQDGWVALLADVRGNLHLDPASPQAQELGRRWQDLTEQTMRGYQAFPELKQAISENYKQGKFEGFSGAPQKADLEFIERVKNAKK